MQNRTPEERNNCRHIPLKAINSIYESAANCQTTEQLGKVCLAVIEELTESKMSFVALMGEDGLNIVTVSMEDWDQSKLHDLEARLKHQDDFRFHGLHGSVITTGETLLTNSPASHPVGIDLPPGHLPLEAFLGVPFIQNGTVTGMVAAANRPGGYTERQKCILEGLTPTVCEVLLRKRAETALLERENRFRAFVMASSDVLYQMSPDWGVMTQLQSQSFLINTEKPNANWLNDYIPQESQREVTEVIKHAIQTKTVAELEHGVIQADGNIGYTRSRAVPIFDSNGDILEWFGTARDITEHKRGEEALIDSERKAKALVEQLEATKKELTLEVQALNTLYSLNSNFIINDNLDAIYKELLSTYLAITGSRKGCIQAYYENISMLEMLSCIGLSDEFFEFFRRIDLNSSVGGLACRERKRITWADLPLLHQGKPGYAYVIKEGLRAAQSMPLISSSGKLVGVLNSYYETSRQLAKREVRILDMLARLAADTIERAKTEEALHQSRRDAYQLIEELQHADKNKNLFLSALSHELRNPIATISAGMQLMDISRDAAQTENAKRIIGRQMKQLSGLVDDLLDLSRINMNRIELKREIVDLSATALSVAEDYRAQFEEKGIQLDIDIGKDALYIHADKVRINQIIGNYLHNALKFTTPGIGRVCLYVGADNDEAVVSVTDNGIGIDPEFLPYLFEPFKQADKSLDRKAGGLGLGLSIVKGMTELHGGSAYAESMGLDKGACFYIRLPIEQSAGVKKTKHKKIKSKSDLTILLIDDNKDFAHIFSQSLRLSGYATTVAADGAEGIQKAKEILPDVIICDIGLPNISGYEVARRIRSMSVMKDVYLIALTGYGGPFSPGEEFETDFNRILSKPVELSVINQILARYQQGVAK